MSKKYTWWKSIFVGLLCLIVVVIDESWNFNNLVITEVITPKGKITRIKPEHLDGRGLVVGLVIYDSQEDLSITCKKLDRNYKTLSCIEPVENLGVYCTVHTTEKTLPKIYGVMHCIVSGVKILIKSK